MNRPWFSVAEAVGKERTLRLPFAHRILLENVLRHEGREAAAQMAEALEGLTQKKPRPELAFRPERVLLQDASGLPVLLDLAGMREEVQRRGGKTLEPLRPVALVIDHSLQVDVHGTPDAEAKNLAIELERNQERNAFFKWAGQAFRNVQVFPPGSGICHQINLEYLATVVADNGSAWVPDTVIGTDSHTPMVSGIGVLGWGVGGIEAELALLGEPLIQAAPPVIGVELLGQLAPGVTATDVALTLTQMLRKVGVVETIVEFFGPGVAGLAVADRATLSNMSPEFGATTSFFPVDARTLEYLRATGRTAEHLQRVESYCRAQHLFAEGAPPTYAQVVTVNLGSIGPCVAGPARPQDRLQLSEVSSATRSAIAARRKAPSPTAKPSANRPGDASIAVAAITSCTNTSNPTAMVLAGLVAERALAQGLRPPSWLKASLAPGSRVVSHYLRQAKLLEPLEKLGFALVGHGCATCVGNSGPLTQAASDAAEQDGAVLAAVLSGNRNFEGRINRQVALNFLASPALVVAYAIAGTVDIDLSHDPLGHSPTGMPVYLRDLWPSPEALAQRLTEALFRIDVPAIYREALAHPAWAAVQAPSGQRYAWEAASTYLRPPRLGSLWQGAQAISGAKCLAFLGDSVTTDHISPVGEIAPETPAATYLASLGVKPADFNTYGSRRGNFDVMVRGTFANVRLRNRLVEGVEGGKTLHLSSNTPLSIFDASRRYAEEQTPLIVLAGKEYGSGSARDWAARGTQLLGVRAVFAQSFERIHRSNLVCFGVLPLEFEGSDTAQSLGLTGHETFQLGLPDEDFTRTRSMTVTAQGAAELKRFRVRVRLDTEREVEYFRRGGALPFLVERLTQAA
ncbi:MAG: aconitate hydratase AcnA [Myxococcaceae bacterium]